MLNNHLTFGLCEVLLWKFFEVLHRNGVGFSKGRSRPYKILWLASLAAPSTYSSSRKFFWWFWNWNKPFVNNVCERFCVTNKVSHV